MEDFLTHFVTDLAERISGPMHFRIYLQPMVAIAFAIRDGYRDACEGRPAYVRSLVADPAQRRALLGGGWKSVSRVFVVAWVLDIIYQFVALQGFRPLEGISTAILLALVPYLLLRGPMNRFVRRYKGEQPPQR